MIKLIYGLDTYNGGYLVYRLHDDGEKLRLRRRFIYTDYKPFSEIAKDSVIKKL